MLLSILKVLDFNGRENAGDIYKEYPSVKLMQTESECGNGEKNWVSAEYTWSLKKNI